VFKAINSIIISFIAALLLLFGIAPAAQAEDVAVIIGENNNIYYSALDGFKSTCNASMREYPMKGSDQESATIINLLRSRTPKLIFAIGNKAAQLANTNFSDIPIVFSLCANPVKYGLTGSNICGVSLNVSSRDQLQMLKKVAPSVRRVGMVYTPSSNANLVEEARGIAESLGLEIVASQTSTTADVSDAINGLSGRIDAFWMIVDPLVSNMDVLKRLLLLTLSDKIPLIVPAQPFVEGGGLLALTINYPNAGKQAGEMANQILAGSKFPSSFGTQSPTGTGLALNLKIAKSIGLAIPQSIIDSATKLYNE
jgi:putative tryptophan/tyrosine transport system substrate-binding protein